MRSERRLRRLVVDGSVAGGATAHLWSVRHRHSTEESCQEVLSLHRGERTTRLVFRGSEGRFVPDGFLHPGCVALGGQAGLNLHEPGVVRAFADEAARRGLLTGSGSGFAELDGWELFPAVAATLAADG
ncbi:hypothetical protein [Streptomyces sp. KMM 9044]|uniref:hypothetical protein n=1 Tax=Streptomyces sp. KMM 9044 TaxID=2744474 RepID=UPI0021511143|nr:hypothetical protein [Streptomyces sp. KMM 9044]WAX80138.1 hypothetical protein HUV60_023235 [Streptomyces sp. KMM 9044]